MSHSNHGESNDRAEEGFSNSLSTTDEEKAEQQNNCHQLSESGEKGDAPPRTNAGPGSPPDGGLQAWLQVLGGFMLFFNTWGILKYEYPWSFDCCFQSGERGHSGHTSEADRLQTFYESGQSWQESSSNISWIGSIQALMVLLVGAVSGPIFDRGFLRALLLFGSFMVVFGHMMLSLTRNFWQALLAQGFTVGIGAGCLFVPAVAILPTYFSKKLGLAVGVAASGSSMGWVAFDYGIIYPIMFYKLIDEVGYPWTVRILGFIALATLLIPIVVMKQRVKPSQARSIVDWTAFTDLPYMIFVLGALVGFIGIYVAFFYTSYYGQQTGLTNESLSFYLVPILNAGSVFGRTLPNILSDKIGPINVIAPGALMVGVVLLCYIAAGSAASIIVLAVLFGFFSGIFIALPPVVFVALTADKSKIGSRIGMGFAMLGLGVLAGGPGGGAILGTDPANPNWTGTWAYAGVCALGAGVVFCGLRVMKGGLGAKVKV